MRPLGLHRTGVHVVQSNDVVRGVAFRFKIVDKIESTRGLDRAEHVRAAVGPPADVVGGVVRADGPLVVDIERCVTRVGVATDGDHVVVPD